MIREAGVADAAAIARVQVDTWRTAYAGIVPAAYLAAASYAESEERWRERLLGAVERNGFAYVAEDAAAAVIGFAVGGPERYGDLIYSGELYGLYILDSYQRQGIGRRLVTAVARRLREQGHLALLVWVLARNPARAFYEKLGGQPLYRRTISVGGAELEEVAYGWPDTGFLTG